MQLTNQQKHVLDNLDRVLTTPYKLNVRAPRSLRYSLDGKDCQMQVASLLARKIIDRQPSGVLAVSGGMAEELSRREVRSPG